MHRTLIFILLFTICLSSCSPLRHVRRAEQVDSTIIDNSVTQVRDTLVEVVNQVVTQTVIEYYPVYDTVYIQTPAVAQPIPSEVATTIPQPIKSITRTEIRTEATASAAKDSVILKDTVEEVSRESDTETEDLPHSPAVISIKWIAIALIALCVIIILIRFKFLL